MNYTPSPLQQSVAHTSVTLPQQQHDEPAKSVDAPLADRVQQQEQEGSPSVQSRWRSTKPWLRAAMIQVVLWASPEGG
jgi:hypothetical protein